MNKLPLKFNPNLLSMPIFGYNSDYLYEISQFILKKMHFGGSKKHPQKMKQLMNKYNLFMELYERAKTQERENKGKTSLKTQWFGYRPRLANRNDQRIFERLNNRTETSKLHRRNNEISKV